MTAKPYAALLLPLLWPASASAQGETCTITHYRVDGGVSHRRGPAPDAGTGQASASASTTSRDRSRARSSVSVSSSSSSTGASSARSSSSHEGEGRSVSVTRDQRGCRVVIDERTAGNSGETDD